jgi:hypothetical protein
MLGHPEIRAGNHPLGDSHSLLRRALDISSTEIKHTNIQVTNLIMILITLLYDVAEKQNIDDTIKNSHSKIFFFIHERHTPWCRNACYEYYTI